MIADPDRACDHENFRADVEIHRLASVENGPITGYSADIRVSCVDCGEVFRWIGAPTGLSPRHPAVSLDGAELHAPLRPASSDPDFGLGLPGFSVRQVR